MLLPPETLTPANPEAMGVLPPVHVCASDMPSLPEVRKVYPQAIEVTDMMAMTSGAFLLIGGLTSLGSLALGSWIVWVAVSEGSYGVALAFAIPLALLSVGGYFLFRVDSTGYRCLPVMFNRGGAGGRGTVHYFYGDDISIKLFRPRPKHIVRSYPWDCVRAEITSAVVGTAPFVHRQCFLTLAITEAPGTNRVVDRFKVGLANSPQGIANFWEHLRRYMRENGPAVSERTESIASLTTMLPLWRYLFTWQPFLGPDVYLYAGLPMWLRVPLGVVLLFTISVFGIPYGLCRWLSMRLKVEPRWPAAVLASAGGAALSPQQVAQSGRRPAAGADRSRLPSPPVTPGAGAKR